MKNIGKRIKDLRKKNDLTQEKLADLLGVTYKSVSKWECGLTSPDLAMIVPLARVLHVSADELLGMKPTEQDERKAYFDAEYDEFWKKEDHKADYLLAKQAVKEYPEEYKYWHWLGTVEYYLSFDQKPEEFMEWIDNSIKHNLIAYENGDSEDCKDCALWDIICAYRYSNRMEEAKKYAELFPEIFTTRDDALALCLEGEELLTHQQKMLHNIETMRDSSHTRILSKTEFEKLFENHFDLQTEEITYVPVNLQSWMDLTDTPWDIQEDIVRRMNDDLNGGDKTGFYPYIKEGKICFDHRWLLLIGIKKSSNSMLSENI